MQRHTLRHISIHFTHPVSGGWPARLWFSKNIHMNEREMLEHIYEAQSTTVSVKLIQTNKCVR